MDKLWQIKKDEHGVNHWTINEKVFSNKKEELGEENNETIIDEILYDYGTDTNT